LARKINYEQTTALEGVIITDADISISYLAETSADNLAFHQQYFIIPANTAYKEISLSLRSDAQFTYFFEQSMDVFSEVTVKVNGNDTEFNVSPDLWLEQSLTTLEAQNLQNQDRLIYVSQVYVQGVSYNGSC